MKNQMIPLAAACFVAIVSLAACGEREPSVVGDMADPNADELADAEPVELPPMERGSASYRCGDNSVVYVTYFTDDTQVGVATEQNGVKTFLHNEANADTAPTTEAEAEADAPAEAPAEPAGPVRFSGEGYTVVGTGNSIQFARPGGGLQNCNR